MFVVSNQAVPKFCRLYILISTKKTKKSQFRLYLCSHNRFLGGVRCLKNGDKLINDIKADREKMKGIYKANNPYIPSYLKPKASS